MAMADGGAPGGATHLFIVVGRITTLGPLLVQRWRFRSTAPFLFLCSQHLSQQRPDPTPCPSTTSLASLVPEVTDGLVRPGLLAPERAVQHPHLRLNRAELLHLLFAQRPREDVEIRLRRGWGLMVGSKLEAGAGLQPSL